MECHWTRLRTCTNDDDMSLARHVLGGHVGGNNFALVIGRVVLVKFLIRNLASSVVVDLHIRFHDKIGTLVVCSRLARLLSCTWYRADTAKGVRVSAPGHKRWMHCLHRSENTLSSSQNVCSEGIYPY